MELADLEQEMPANKAVEESKQDRSEAQESHQEVILLLYSFQYQILKRV